MANVTPSSGGVRFSDLRTTGDAIDYSQIARKKPVSFISGSEPTPWTRFAFSDAVKAKVEPSPRYGYAVRCTTPDTGASQYVVASRKIQPLLLTDGEILNLQLYVENPNLCQNIQITLANDLANANRAIISPGNAWHYGENNVTWKLSDCSFTGTADANTQWNYIRISVNTTAIAVPQKVVVDIGKMWIGGAARIPMMCITCDRGYDGVYDYLYPMLKAHGLRGSVYSMPKAHSQGVAGTMSPARLRDLYANGWDIGIYAGANPANSHSYVSVAQSQAVGAGGNFVLNGTMSVGGKVVLDTPRFLVARIASGSESGNAYIITGTREDGSVGDETLLGYVFPTAPVTTYKYREVTSIVALNATSVNVSWGTAYSYQENLDQYKFDRGFLDANGLIRGSLHHCYSANENNADSQIWMREVGLISNRTGYTGPKMQREGNLTHVNPYYIPCTVTLGDPNTNTFLRTEIQKYIDRGLQANTFAHLGGVVGYDLGELEKTVSWIASLHRQEIIRVVTLSEWEQVQAAAIKADF